MVYNISINVRFSGRPFKRRPTNRIQRIEVEVYFTMKNDIVIIGAGAAGLSAALYTVRAGLVTTVVRLDAGSLGRADKIENYFGFAAPVSGRMLLAATEQNLRRLGCRFMDGEVVSIRGEREGFSVSFADGTAEECACVLLATGRSLPAPRIRGLKEFEGKGVSHCAVCDGFFFRGKAVGVLGSGEFALSEARELLPLAASVAFLTNGEEPSFVTLENEAFDFYPQKVIELNGAEKLSSVTFEDGAVLPLDGLFVAPGSAGALDFASHLGIISENGIIVVDADGMTNVPGVFAAGDCTGAPYQVSVSVGRGCTAALGAVNYLRGHVKFTK